MALAQINGAEASTVSKGPSKSCRLYYNIPFSIEMFAPDTSPTKRGTTDNYNVSPWVSLSVWYKDGEQSKNHHITLAVDDFYKFLYKLECIYRKCGKIFTDGEINHDQYDSEQYLLETYKREYLKIEPTTIVTDTKKESAFRIILNDPAFAVDLTIDEVGILLKKFSSIDLYNLTLNLR
jgi:hypothetical protein